MSADKDTRLKGYVQQVARRDAIAGNYNPPEDADDRRVYEQEYANTRRNQLGDGHRGNVGSNNQTRGGCLVPLGVALIPMLMPFAGFLLFLLFISYFLRIGPFGCWFNCGQPVLTGREKTLFIYSRIMTKDMRVEESNVLSFQHEYYANPDLIRKLEEFSAKRYQDNGHVPPENEELKSCIVSRISFHDCLEDKFGYRFDEDDELYDAEFMKTLRTDTNFEYEPSNQSP